VTGAIDMSHIRRCKPAAAGLLAPLALGLLLLPDAASADSSVPIMCKDGTTVAQGSGGACNGHGGIDTSASQASTGNLRASSAGSSSVRNSVGPNSGDEAGVTRSPAGESMTESVRCKDGAVSPQGAGNACSGHGGIDGPTRASNGKASATDARPTRRTSDSSSSGSSAGATSSARAAPAMVWVNAQSKLYHCPSDRWYGRTPQGKFMTEAQAKSQGYRPDRNRPCD
jgi:hypothetical protein